jgi:hypothetical protein
VLREQYANERELGAVAKTTADKYRERGKTWENEGSV